MNPDQPEFKALSNKVDEIHGALIGDPMRGKVGFIQGHHRLMQDMYGVDASGEPIEGSEKNTMLYRMSKTEDNQKKVVWIFSGVVAAITAIKCGISSILDKVFK